MHPRQAGLIKQASLTLELINRMANQDPSGSAKEWQEGAEQDTSKTASAILFKYTCPETGTDFWTEKKQTTIKSPFTGKSFAAKPEKSSLGDVGKEIKKDQAEAKSKTAAAILFKYTCPETGHDFWTEKKQTTIKSPFTGKSFAAKPEKSSLGDVGKEVKKDQAEAKSKTASAGASLEYRLPKETTFKTASFSDYSEALRWADHLIQKEGKDVEIRWNA